LILAAVLVPSLLKYTCKTALIVLLISAVVLAPPCGYGISQFRSGRLCVKRRMLSWTDPFSFMEYQKELRRYHELSEGKIFGAVSV